MKKLVTNVLAIAAFTFGFASMAQAQATRTWVSGVGDDANPCSRTAPCKTFAGAISKTATGGEIDVLDPGGFGALTITKGITIDGSGGSIAGVLTSGVNGIVVQAPQTDVVTLRNLDINGAGTTLGINGIRFLSGRALHVEHCEIYNYSQNGIDANISAVQANVARLFVNDTVIRACAAGVNVASTGTAIDAILDNLRIQDNTGFGISASGNNAVEVIRCIITRNGGEAVKTSGSASAFITSSILNSNLTGVAANGASTLLMDTTIFNNGTGVSGTVTTFGNNNVRANGGGNTLPAPVGQQ